LEHGAVGLHASGDKNNQLLLPLVFSINWAHGHFRFHCVFQHAQIIKGKIITIIQQ
jgi:hypothetical protein